jgi:hypothetical protein
MSANTFQTYCRSQTSSRGTVVEDAPALCDAAGISSGQIAERLGRMASKTLDVALQIAFSGDTTLLTSTFSTLPSAGNIVARWAADSLSLADGAAVASWTDSVGGNAATQGAGANQPTFKTNQFGTKPVVRFDGVNDVLQIGRPAAMVAAVDSQIFTLAIVCRVVSAKANGMMFGAANGGDAFQMVADGVHTRNAWALQLSNEMTVGVTALA